MSIRTWVWRGLLALLLLILLYQLWIFLHICYWVHQNPASTAFMRDRLQQLQKENPEARLKHQWVDYQHISINLKRAVVAAEDSKFAQHDGFDWDGIQQAYEKNLKKGRLVAGGSTISQQLAKNLFLSSQRTPWRKLQEAVITLMLEKMMSKRRILEIYLNVIEWGNGVFGADAAARHYYGTGARHLSGYEAAKMAAMIPNPRYYDKHRSTRFLNRKTGTIQSRMRLVEVPK
ncbi:MAG: monofunctional biosynthetic peptidoglycan transglycosylase [Betaproteobacteria bacterium HGW-Betaproteobacteria-2]|nr:MAG: monofunctional biosynthetic peptidoglycan transglycosylase [Betaproteobacteria bacterium HGW-Betaproteobacteria-2]